jgi:flavin reductase (DIM6/NTAB) family NADH-FMN oxidoreductase RutF
MLFDLRNAVGFDPYSLAVAAVAPRPIAWVGTRSDAGVLNLAPFSYFGLVASEPITFALGIARRGGTLKDTAQNLLQTREAVVHLPSEGLAMAMLRSSADVAPEIDEFQLAGLESIPGECVAAPRIPLAPIAFECRMVRHLELGTEVTDLFLLEALVAHVRDEVLTAGLPDPAKIGFLGRLGGPNYCVVRETIALRREQ